MLTPEEQFLWECARSWRDPCEPDVHLNWSRVVQLAVQNRMGPLLQHVLLQYGATAQIPQEARQALRGDVAVQRYRAWLFGHELQRFLKLAAERDLHVVVIKGLWLSSKIYGQDYMRPGGDIDLLLRRRDVREALNILDYQMGYGRWWRPILDDAYYARHHLHQQRCNPGRAVWFEPHWRLDHPYNMLTINYDAMLARSTAATLLGEPMRELAPADLLLSLVVHLAKHALYLTSTLERHDLPRLILADGMLIYYVDVAEAIRCYSAELDWDRVVARARAAGAAADMGAVLRVCARLLCATVPEDVLQALPVGRPDQLTYRLMNGMADHLLACHAGVQSSRVWSFLAGFQESMIFRPIRLLDFARYCVPDRDYLQRRYGTNGKQVAAWHLLSALAQYARLAGDTVYYGWRRQRRIRNLNPEELDRCDARYDPIVLGDDAYGIEPA